MKNALCLGSGEQLNVLEAENTWLGRVQKPRNKII